MSQPQLRPAFDRRHPPIPYDELRRQLRDADQDRYRLHNELRASHETAGVAWATWPIAARRAAFGAAILILTSIAGGLAWQMCTSAARADDRASVRVQETSIVPRFVAMEVPAARPARAAIKVSRPVPRAKLLPAARSRAVVHVHHAPSAPRPLSPGEFGRPRAAY